VLLRLFATVVDGDSKVQLKHVSKDEWKWCVQWLSECTKDRVFGAQGKRKKMRWSPSNESAVALLSDFERKMNNSMIQDNSDDVKTLPTEWQIEWPDFEKLVVDGITSQKQAAASAVEIAERIRDQIQQAKANE